MSFGPGRKVTRHGEVRRSLAWSVVSDWISMARHVGKQRIEEIRNVVKEWRGWIQFVIKDRSGGVRGGLVWSVEWPGRERNDEECHVGLVWHGTTGLGMSV
jgi:hypothetical protein